MKTEVRKIIFLLMLNVFHITIVSANIIPLQIDFTTFFSHSEKNGQVFIQDIKDIRKMCFFNLDGLKLMPVNLFIEYEPYEYPHSLILGVTANPDDKETVMTYYTAEGRKDSLPFFVHKLRFLRDTYYDEDHRHHQIKQHHRLDPDRSHYHWVYNHPKEVFRLNYRYPRAVTAGNFVLCNSDHTTAVFYPLSLISHAESLDGHTDANTPRFILDNARTIPSYINETDIGIDEVLKDILVGPVLEPRPRSTVLYNNVILAAFIFNAYPDLKCLSIGDTKLFNKGSEDIDNKEESSRCAQYVAQYEEQKYEETNVKQRDGFLEFILSAISSEKGGALRAEPISISAWLTLISFTLMLSN